MNCPIDAPYNVSVKKWFRNVFDRVKVFNWKTFNSHIQLNRFYTKSVRLRWYFSLILDSIARNKMDFFSSTYTKQNKIATFFFGAIIFCTNIKEQQKKSSDTFGSTDIIESYCLPSRINLRLWISNEIESCCDRNALTWCELKRMFKRYESHFCTRAHATGRSS